MQEIWRGWGGKDICRSRRRRHDCCTTSPPWPILYRTHKFPPLESVFLGVFSISHSWFRAQTRISVANQQPLAALFSSNRANRPTSSWSYILLPLQQTNNILPHPTTSLPTHTTLSYRIHKQTLPHHTTSTPAKTSQTHIYIHTTPSKSPRWIERTFFS
jgi:hypothetical protein